MTSQDTEAISSEWKFHKVFKIEKTSWKRSYTNRRDVISKSIIRYFYKYLWKLFKQKILNKRYLRTANSLAQRIQDILSSYEGTQENTLDSDRHTLNNELSHFIFWIVWKNQSCLKKHFESEQFSEIFSQNEENLINTKSDASTIMDNILKRYSHSNLQRFFENKILRVLFTKFMESESENFLNKTQSCKRAKTEEILRDFETNLFLFSN